MPRVFATVLLAFGLLVAALGPAASDLVITLKDGRVLRVPVEADEVRSLTFEEGTSGADQGAGADTTGGSAETAAGGVAPSGPLTALVPAIPPATRSNDGAPIQVGPTRKYKVPSQAARVALDGAVIEIDAGTYAGDVAVWKQNNLTIRGVGGLAHIDAAGNAAGGKAIWVIRGDNVTIENVELSGCKVPDRNGAGIRLEGANFTLRNSFIHDNEMGILTGKSPQSDILIEGSELARNTVDYKATGSLGHNIYIGIVRSFTLRSSYVHLASIGHNVKSRATNNYILYNRIMDGDEGNSSYLIDLAAGGNAYVVGNLLHKNRAADNWAMIAYASESGKQNADSAFYVVNNTAVSDLREGQFVRNHGAALTNAINNIFAGGQTLVDGPSNLQSNIVDGDPGLVDTADYDYRLAAGSPAIDAGVDAVTADGVSLRPESQYRQPMSSEPRQVHGQLDVGAYEAGAD